MDRIDEQRRTFGAVDGDDSELAADMGLESDPEGEDGGDADFTALDLKQMDEFEPPLSARNPYSRPVRELRRVKQAVADELQCACYLDCSSQLS